MTWLDGHSLVQTVFTCLYMHNPFIIENPCLKVIVCFQFNYIIDCSWPWLVFIIKSYLVQSFRIICKWLIYNINNNYCTNILGILYSHVEVMWYYQVYCKQSSSIWGGKTDLLKDYVVLLMSGLLFIRMSY